MTNADELLQRVLGGELDPDAEEVRILAASDPDFAARLSDARDAVAALERAGRHEREVLREAQAMDSLPVEDAIESRVLATLAPTVEGDRTAPSRAWWWLAAAAVLLVGIPLTLRALREPGGLRPGDTLGGGIELLAPRGEVDAFGDFTWRAELPERGWFTVVIYSEDGIEVDRSPDLAAPRWTPDGETIASWPKDIRWRVFAYDAGGGEFAGSDGVQASRP